MKKEIREKICGKIFPSVEKIKIPPNKEIIAVGDVASYSLIKAGFKPRIIVFDGKIERKAANPEITKVLEKYCKRGYRVRNPAGHITSELWRAVKKVAKLRSRVKIFVEGEEDLAAFPFIFEVEKSNIIVFGFRKKGIVVLRIDEKLRKKAKELLNAMRSGPVAQHGRAAGF